MKWLFRPMASLFLPHCIAPSGMQPPFTNGSHPIRTENI